MQKPLGIILDGIRLGKAYKQDDYTLGENTAEAIGGVAGGWAGAIGGAALGAKGGALIGGLIGGPVGFVVGGFVGGLIGGYWRSSFRRLSRQQSWTPNTQKSRPLELVHYYSIFNEFLLRVFFTK